MTRFTDAIFFGFLFALDALAWLIVWATGSFPAVAPDQLAPMTVAIVVVIAAPVLAGAAFLSLIRAAMKVSPRLFWTWASGASFIFLVLTVLAFLLTGQIQLEVGFGTSVWFMLLLTASSLVALVLALVGAIGAPAGPALAVPPVQAETSAEEIEVEVSGPAIEEGTAQFEASPESGPAPSFEQSADE